MAVAGDGDAVVRAACDLDVAGLLVAASHHLWVVAEVGEAQASERHPRTWGRRRPASASRAVRRGRSCPAGANMRRPVERRVGSAVDHVVEPDTEQWSVVSRLRRGGDGPCPDRRRRPVRRHRPGARTRRLGSGRAPRCEPRRSRRSRGRRTPRPRTPARNCTVRSTEPVSPTTTWSTRPSRLARQSPSMASSSRTIRVATSSGRPSGPTPSGYWPAHDESCAATAPSATTTGSVHRRTIARGSVRRADARRRIWSWRPSTHDVRNCWAGRVGLVASGAARAHEPQSGLQEVTRRTRWSRARCCAGPPGRRWRVGQLERRQAARV